jgi:hypothetical protein
VCAIAWLGLMLAALAHTVVMHAAPRWLRRSPVRAGPGVRACSGPGGYTSTETQWQGMSDNQGDVWTRVR